MGDANWKQQEQAAAKRELVLEAVGAYIEEHGHSPTRQELAKVTGFTETTVRRAIERLEDDGRLIRGEGHRTLRLAP